MKKRLLFILTIFLLISSCEKSGSVLIKKNKTAESFEFLDKTTADITFLSTQLNPVEEAGKMRNVILSDFPGNVLFRPNDNNYLFSQIDSTSAMSMTNAILLKNHTDYTYSKFSDYIIRINNETLTVLESQKKVIGHLKTMILNSSLIALCAAALTIVLLKNRKNLFSQSKKAGKLLLKTAKLKANSCRI